MDRFVCVDIEMPNGDCNRISAIGVAVFENGVVTERRYALINPETWFQPYVISLIGITPQMVENAPTFGEYWPTIAPLLENSILVAHGAGNDLKALSGCLHHYNIAWQSETQYLCTMDACRACYPDRTGYGLEQLCADYSIALVHHNALSDAESCGKLLLQCLQDGLDAEPLIKMFDLVNGHAGKKARRRTPPRKKPSVLAAQDRVRKALQPFCSDAQRLETARILSLPPERVLGAAPVEVCGLAQALSSQDFHNAFLKALPHDYLEEDLLHALLLSQRSRYTQTVRAIEAFLPHIDNAQVCAALRPKIFQKKQPELSRKLRKWLLSDEKYTVLFALQTLERFYVKTQWLPMFLDIVACIVTTDSDLTQAKVAFFARALRLEPQKTLAFLRRRDLGELTKQAAALALESGHCSLPTAEALRELCELPAPATV